MFKVRKAARQQERNRPQQHQHQHERSSSGATTTSGARPLVSPLQMTFDFELAPPSAETEYRVSRDSLRPGTSDGLLGNNQRKNTSIVGLAPPVLPPIPRVASTRLPDAPPPPPRSRDDADNISTSSKASSRKSFFRPTNHHNHPVDLLPPLSRATSSGRGDAPNRDPSRPATAGAKLVAGTLFSPYDSDPPPHPPSPPPPPTRDAPRLPPINSGPAMSPEFIDSRDKPYSPRPPPLQKTQTAPLTVQTQVVSGSFSHGALTAYSPSPISPALPRPSSSGSLRAPKISGTRLSPNSSVEDLRATLQRQSTNGMTLTGSNSVYGGPSMAKGHSPATHSPLAQTIGTPYQETSAAFPLPQHVATRPRTAGATSTVAGVSVPTHHTSTTKPDGAITTATKSERRKTRLLNPMAFLSRRKSGQEVDVTDAERSAAAQAYARQRSVAAGGLNRLPEDFDPRIKGKVVHDFSAPRRPPGSFSHHESDRRPPERPLQTANSAPSVPLLFTDPYPYRDQPLSDSKHTSDSSSSNRKSVHSAMFREMLTENPDATKRVSSLNAERLENRDFLQRVSHHSSPSNFSQESAVLPPFARRSQVLDATQASFYNDEESKRSSNPSTHKGRDSNSSSISQISPITARSSNPNVDLRNSLGLSLSPVSPTSPNKGVSSRPISIISDLPPPSREAPALPGFRGRTASETTARPFSDGAVSTLVEQPSITRERSPYRNSALAPEVVVTPERQSSLFAAPEPWDGTGTSSTGTLIFDKTSSLATPSGTPEIAQAETVSAAKVPQSPPKLVEKRASAVGHGKRGSLGPKHHVSNASRFSFQFESAIEEKALEEKHRKIRGQSGEGMPRGASLDDEEDGEFDEDAMDDMDELEVQQQQLEGAAQAPATGLVGLQQARKQLQLAESDGSDYAEEDDDVLTDEREVTYALHPAFRTHSALAGHSRTGSQGTYAGWSILDGTSPQRSNLGYDRRPSDESALTVDTMLATQAGRRGFGQDPLPVNHPAAPRSGFYMQPQAAGYSPTTDQHPDKPSSAATDSATPDRSKAGSRMSFASVDSKQRRRLSGMALTADHQRLLSQSTVGGSTTSEARTLSTGLGLSGFSDFNFSDSPEATNGSRPISFALGQNNENRRTKDSETIPSQTGWGDFAKNALAGTSPLETGNRKSSILSSTSPDGPSAAYHGSIGQDIQARNAGSTTRRRDVPVGGEDDRADDMYFDDGGFEQDIRHPPPSDIAGARVNENDFDDEAFLGGVRRPPGRKAHQRDLSAVSMGSDGPYPSFAMGANPLPARQRQSQMLLEDLPLQGPVDPKLIPQRNPSEDAKRLGLSNKVPPLPLPPDSHEAVLRQMQANLQAYHAALAEAANQAAADGRFIRQPSAASTTHNLSVRSRGPGGEGEDKSPDDRSHYSRDEAGNASNGGGLTVPGDDGGVHRSISEATTGSRMEQGQAYSPLKMLDFDFGFNDSAGTPPPPLLSSGGLVGFSDDDFGTTDDDIVAAANAEVLASDDAAFYGQEFGFYAHARPQAAGAAAAVATDGGFFGDEGDDGLARTRSSKEPDLTPITERSEFSTRNSFVNLGPHVTGGGSAGYAGGTAPPIAGTSSGSVGRMVPVSPLAELQHHYEGTAMASSFDQLRKLRANAFGGSNGSLRSEFSLPSAVAGRSSVGGSPWMFDADSIAATAREGHESGSSPPSSSSTTTAALFHSDGDVVDQDVTPKKSAAVPTETRRKTQTHSRQGRGGGGVGEVTTSYVQEPDPAGGDLPPRWVLERRRTSEQGQLELVGREVVPGGWI